MPYLLAPPSIPTNPQLSQAAPPPWPALKKKGRLAIALHRNRADGRHRAAPPTTSSPPTFPVPAATSTETADPCLGPVRAYTTDAGGNKVWDDGAPTRSSAESTPCLTRCSEWARRLRGSRWRGGGMSSRRTDEVDSLADTSARGKGQFSLVSVPLRLGVAAWYAVLDGMAGWLRGSRRTVRPEPAGRRVPAVHAEARRVSRVAGVVAVPAGLCGQQLPGRQKWDGSCPYASTSGGNGRNRDVSADVFLFFDYHLFYRLPTNKPYDISHFFFSSYHEVD